MNREIHERIRQHYLLEKSLARRILTSARENRTQVAIEAYDELFSRIFWHHQLHRSEEEKRERVAEKWMFFGHLFHSRSDILDIGAGSAHWTRFLASKSAGRCVGIDVSKEILFRPPGDPPNLELCIMDAVELDFPADSFDVALSSQLIEHLHPDDLDRHFVSVYKVLKEQGLYAFDTPSRLDGPHDISKHFDDVATGFHLKEWTYSELAAHLRKAGFTKIKTMALPWRLVRVFPFLRSLGTLPVSLLTPGERLVQSIKHKPLRTRLCQVFRVTPIYIIAHKGKSN
jgi:SAM-dependent methyltransferase